MDKSYNVSIPVKDYEELLRISNEKCSMLSLHINATVHGIGLYDSVELKFHDNDHDNDEVAKRVIEFLKKRDQRIKKHIDRYEKSILFKIWSYFNSDKTD